jgi:acyl carrier protein
LKHGKANPVLQIRREEFQQLFAEIFEVDADLFTLAAGPDDIGTWDSFNHLNMTVALEERCEVSFSTDEIASMLTVGTIVGLLRDRGVEVDWPE